MKSVFKGTGVALVTPFRTSGTIDYQSLNKLVDNIISKGVDFVLALGTTSEAATMSQAERSAVVEAINETVEGRVPVMIGIGGNNTAEVCEKIRNTKLDDISGILSVSPYYNKPQQGGIYEHFKNVAGETDKEIILYNVPGRTSSNMSAETTLELSEIENITAIKEASGDLNQIMEIIRNKDDDFSLISGDDALTFPILSLGGAGVISVMANAYPKTMSQMVKMALQGKYEKSRELHFKMLESMDAIFEDGNPSGVKAMLAHQGMITNEVRLPLIKVNRSLNFQIKKLVDELKLD